MRSLLFGVLLLVAREAKAESSIAVQAGALPNVSVVGAELRHVMAAHFEIAASASYGLAAVTSVVARARWQLAPAWALATGLGPSIAYEKGGPLEDSRTYGQVCADAELNVETSDDWLLQVRAGASGYRETLPFVGLGIGRSW